MSVSKPHKFNPQFLDRFIRLPNCCSDCILQSIIYWILIILSIFILYFEWLLSLKIIQLSYFILNKIMKSITLLLFPVYFRYLKPKFKNLLKNKSFRKRNNSSYGMRRNTSDVIAYESKVGGRVYYDVTNKITRIERSHPDQLEGEPKCRCCPPPMSGQRMLIVGEYAYVYGGLCQKRVQVQGDAHLSTSVWRLRLLDNTWTKIPLEQEAHNVTPISYSWIATRKWGILTFGGTGYPFGQYNGDRLCRLQLVNSDGEYKYILNCLDFKGKLPPACYGAVLVADEDNDCIYLMGGTDGHEYYQDVYQGIIKSQDNGNFSVLWEKISEKCLSIGGRYRHESVLFDNKLLFFGGGNNEELYSISDITYFDLKNRHFGVLNTEKDSENGYPLPRDCFALTKYENTVYIMGGRGAVDGSLLFNDIWSLDLLSMEWTKRQMTLSFKTSFHSGAIDSEGKVYIFGGHRGGLNHRHGVARTNMIQSFLSRPISLQTICKRFIAQTYKKNIILNDTANMSITEFLRQVLPYYNGQIKIRSRTSSRLSSTSSSSYN